MLGGGVAAILGLSSPSVSWFICAKVPHLQVAPVTEEGPWEGGISASEPGSSLLLSEISKSSRTALLKSAVYSII